MAACTAADFSLSGKLSQIARAAAVRYTCTRLPVVLVVSTCLSFWYDIVLDRVYQTLLIHAIVCLCADGKEV